MNPTFTKNYVAEAAINPFRIVSRGTAEGEVKQGASTTDTLFGVTGELGAAINERIDVHQGGQPDVEFGGTVAVGNPLTSDATGRAIAAAPGAGVNARIIGFAAVPAVVGDIRPFDYAPGQIQG